MRKTRRPNRYPDRDNEARVNDRIRAPRVLVIDEQGEKLGEFLTKDAVDLARSRGLDLIEVASSARPPVCRITDYGRLKYEKKKKDALARKNQATVSVKEVKIRRILAKSCNPCKPREEPRDLAEGQPCRSRQITPSTSMGSVGGAAPG